MQQSGTFTVVTALTAGIIGQTLARHLRFPAIIALLGIGIVIGPDGLHWIDPSQLGHLLPILVGFAVAIILFEGGLQLEVRRLRQQASVIRRLISLGAILTALMAAALTHWVMGWTWQISLLFGTLVIVTGPTVVTPLLRRVKVSRRLNTILEAEGVLIDPVGAIIAVASLDFIIGTRASDALFDTVMFLMATLSFGVLAGLLGGFLIGFSLKSEKLVPRELENIFTLAVVVFLFEVSNQFLQESGIMAVTVAGIVVGNMKLPAGMRIIHFKEQLTTMLIGFLFVLLAADIRLSNVWGLGWPALALVVGLMFVVRPINVFICAHGSRLNWREKLFMSWLAPRGIVAAAVASLFAFDLNRAGIGGGEQMRSLVFMVIAITVVLQGLTAGVVASILGVRRKNNWGFVLVGANELARVLSRILAQNQEEIVHIDSNSANCSAASTEGFRVIYGNGLEESVLIRAGIDLRRSIIAATPNNDINIMVLKRIKELDQSLRVAIASQQGSQLEEKMVKSMEARTLFGCRADFNLWLHRLSQDTAKLWLLSYAGTNKLEITASTVAEGPQNDRTILFLAAKRNGYFEPVFDGIELSKNHEVYILVYVGCDEDELLTWLDKHHLERKIVLLPRELKNDVELKSSH
jgi:NhaP-type Na+/H+ or K+/H+ antiporter